MGSSSSSSASSSLPAGPPAPQHVLDYIVEFLRTEVWPVVALFL